MEPGAQRAALQALIEAHGSDYAQLSRALGRNAAYIQQYMKRGSPRVLPEADRRRAARFLGVADSALGGGDATPVPDSVTVARHPVGASAGPGALVDDDGVPAETQVPRGDVRGIAPDALGIIGVVGDSMFPTLADGDEILVDSTTPLRPRAGLWVMRIDDTLMVKRLKQRDRTWHVVSDNPAIGDPGHYDPARMTLVGRVVRSVRRSFDDPATD